MANTSANNKNPLLQVDWVTLVIYMLLLSAGWVSVVGACHEYGDPSLVDFTARTGKQLIWIGCGLILGTILLFVNNRFFETFANFLYIAMVCVLVITPFIATNTKGSYSWIHLGSVSLQPAEFAKCTTSLALAKLMDTYGFSLSNPRQFIQAGILVILPLLLIILQHETGSALVYLSFFFVFYRMGMSGNVLFIGIAAIIYFVTGLKYAPIELLGTTNHIGDILPIVLCWIFTSLLYIYYHPQKLQAILFGMGGLTLMAGIWFLSSRYGPIGLAWIFTFIILSFAVSISVQSFLHKKKQYALIALFAIGSLAMIHSTGHVFSLMENHQQTRIRVLLGLDDDLHDAGYNVHQSVIAIGSGGLWGKGFLNGTQTKLKYVPEQDTDFIFSAVGEEHGFVGCTIVLLLFAALLLRLIHVAERQTHTFGLVYGYCVASILLFHLVINIGMVLGLTPVIGIPLPFFSYGGSSLWGFTLLLFIFLRIDASKENSRR